MRAKKKSNENEIQIQEKDQEDIKSIDKDQEIIKETKNCIKKTNTIPNQEDWKNVHIKKSTKTNNTNSNRYD